jgi:hypothetical protein
MPVVVGVNGTRRRIALTLGWHETMVAIVDTLRAGRVDGIVT